MSCKIEYINNADLLDNDKIKYENLHKEIINNLLSRQYIAINSEGIEEVKGSLFKPFFYQGQKVLTVVSETISKEKHKQQIQAVDSINSKGNYIKILNSKDGKFQIISVNVVDDIIKDNQNLEESIKESLEKSVEYESDEFDVDTYKNTFTSLEYSEKIQDLYDKLRDNEEAINEQFLEALDKLQEYQDKVIQQKGTFNFRNLTSTIRKLFFNLFYNEEALQKINNIDKIIRSSYNILLYANKQLEKLKESVSKTDIDYLSVATIIESNLNVIVYQDSKKFWNDLQLNYKFTTNQIEALKKQKGETLEEKLENYKKEYDYSSKNYFKNIRNSATSINELSAVYEFLKPFEEIINIGNVANNITYKSNKNLFALEQLIFTSILPTEQTQENRDKIRQIIEDENIKSEYDFSIKLKELFPTISDLQISTALQGSIDGNQFILEAFSKMNTELSNLSIQLVNAHYDVLTNVLYNRQLEVRGLTLEDVANNNLTEEQKQDFKTKEQLKKELRVATNGDVSGINSWFAASDKLNDPTLQLLASVFKREIIKSEFKVNQEQLNSVNDLINLGYNLEGEERKKVDEKIKGIIPYIDKRDSIKAVEFNPEEHYIVKLQYNSLEELKDLENKVPVLKFEFNDKSYYFKVNLSYAYKIKNNPTFLDLERLMLESIIKNYNDEDKGKIRFQFYNDRLVNKSLNVLIDELKEKYEIEFNVEKLDDILNTNSNFASSKDIFVRSLQEKERININEDLMFLNSKNEILVQKENGTFEYVDFSNIKGVEIKGLYSTEYLIVERLEELGIVGIVQKGKIFKQYKSEYNDLFKSKINLTPKEKAYYDYTLNKYNEANRKRGSFFLFGYRLPFIKKKIDLSPKERINETLKSALDVNAKTNKIDRILKPSYSTVFDNILEQESDSFVSNTLLTIDSIKYEGLKYVEPLFNISKNVLSGNQSLSIEQRKALDKGILDNTLRNFTEKEAKKAATKSTSALIEALQYNIYGIKEDITTGNFSWGKAIDKLKYVNSYQLLAMNVTAGLSNYTVGTYNNWMLGFSNKMGIKPENLKEGLKIYAKNVSNGNFFRDSVKNYEHEKSLVSQLAFYFEAIKGNFEEGLGKVDTEHPIKRFLKWGLYAPSTIVEHKNQITLMLALLHNFKIKDKSLFDFIIHEQGKAFEWNMKKFQEEGFNQEQVENILLEFRTTLDTLNNEAHGQFAKLDTNKLQRHAFWSIAYQFSKWIYPSYKARYRQGSWDVMSNSYLEEGYLRTYTKNIFKEFLDMHKTLMKDSAQETLISYFSKDGLKQVGNIGKALVLKQLAHLFNRITFNKLEEIDSIKNFLYKDSSEKEIKRIHAATIELTFWSAAVLTSLILRAVIESDDEEDDIVLKMLVLQAERFQNDVSFFLPTTNPFVLTDKLQFKLKDPFSSGRLLDANLGLLSQIVGFEFNIEDEDKFFIQFNILEQYDRKGVGYEKGDYKIVNKAQKALLSPYYQLIRFMNPQQQLNYLNLLYKNSN